MRLSSLERLPSFALLGPGFGGGQFILLTDLFSCDDVTSATLVFAAYETCASEASYLTAQRRQAVNLEIDTAPASLAPAVRFCNYARDVERIREAIAAGDVYQVNLTLRAGLLPVSGPALAATMCRRDTPRFFAWVRLPGDGPEFLSASPELLFSVEGGILHAEPMKGTAAAGEAQSLELSEKDAAELAMITDLVRNDMTPVCRHRSTRVVHPRRFITLPYAVQTVSDIEGTLLTGTTVREILAALHPGGSVTGAPKQASMRMIRALEPTPRGPYCGTLGYCDGDRATFSLLIRTATRTEVGWTYGVGGGIVYDSDPDREMEEVVVKLGALQ